MDLPEHTARRAEAYLGNYCRRICPQSFERQIELGYRIEGPVITLFEVRPARGTTSRIIASEHDLARFCYDTKANSWSLRRFDRARGWHRYRRMPVTRDFLQLLREVDADPLGVFFSRVNGASLRWCCSQGRCTACDVRYPQILQPHDMPRRNVAAGTG
jgi:hypothetical protein